MTRNSRRPSPMLRLLLLGMLAFCLIGNGWASAMAALPASGKPCAGMMASGSHGDCCDHARPGKPMPPDCVEHCYLLGQLGNSVLFPALPAVGALSLAEPVPLGSLATMHLPARLAPELRPPISA